MILSAISDGFGNQLFMYATAYAAAQRLHTELWLEQFKLDTSDLRNFELDKLHITYDRMFSYRGLRWRPLISAMGKLQRRCLKKKLHRFEEKEIFTYDAAILQVKDNTYLRGFWQNHLYFHPYRQQLRKLFTPRVPLGEEHTLWQSRLATPDSVSVHVRRGDYVQIGCAMADDYYRNAVKQMQEQHPNGRFFVFSDDTDYARGLFERLGVPFTMVQAASPEPTLSDLFLMSYCRHHIIANSSYSWWAAYLGQDDATVIAPLPDGWPRCFYLPEWQVLAADRAPAEQQ